jgi:DUF917 family protein
VYLEAFDTNIMANLVEGAVAKIGFRHGTRDYNGRAYNEVRMNSFNLVGKPMSGAQKPAEQPTGNTTGVAPQPQNNAPTSAENAQGGEADDLPF